MQGRMEGLAVAVVLSAALAVPAVAMDIRVDLNTAATDPTGNWNIQAEPGTMTDLIDYVTGIGTGVDMSVTGSASDSSSNTEWNPSNPGPAWLDTAKDAAMDYYYVFTYDYSSTAALFTFSGLTASQDYRVELVASSDSSSHGDARYSINGAYFDGSSTGMYDAIDGYDNGSWLIWSSVAADEDGELSLMIMTSDPEARGRANALRLTTVPEPASMALMGLGGLGVLLRRRHAGA